MYDQDKSLVAGYQISDKDESSDLAYYGYLHSTGKWYIMEANTANNTFRYVTGTTGYAAAWTGRAGLTYGYFSAVAWV